MYYTLCVETLQNIFILKQRINVSINLTFLLYLQKKPSPTRLVLTTTVLQNCFCFTAADRFSRGHNKSKSDKNLSDYLF